MRIYLVGFMGSGKSRLGHSVSRQLDLPFIDLDQEIEKAAGMPILRLFQTFGETYFRDLEYVSLRQTEAWPGCVVATGGGTFSFPRNRQKISQLGTSLFIDVDFDTIAERLGEKGRHKRPLFHDEARARALFGDRLASYRRADLTVEVHPGDSSAIAAARILRAIREKFCVT